MGHISRCTNLLYFQEKARWFLSKIINSPSFFHALESEIDYQFTNKSSYKSEIL